MNHKPKEFEILKAEKSTDFIKNIRKLLFRSVRQFQVRWLRLNLAAEEPGQFQLGSNALAQGRNREGRGSEERVRAVSVDWKRGERGGGKKRHSNGSRNRNGGK